MADKIYSLYSYDFSWEVIRPFFERVLLLCRFVLALGFTSHFFPKGLTVCDSVTRFYNEVYY
jgi:hypothetical protein